MEDVLDIETLKEAITSADLSTRESAEAFRIAWLSKKQGRITDLMKRIPEVAPDQRKDFGQAVNQLKRLVEGRLEDVQATQASASSLDVDPSLPGREPTIGTLHPITQTRRAILRFFERYGFEVAEGPELEDEWHNFTALNFPADHPARDMQDTLFIRQSDDGDSGVLLRTHTSPSQIRIMKDTAPPIRVVVPGRVYRNEAISYKSYCLFHQVEGLYVDHKVTLGDLRYILTQFARAMFGDDVKMRFRPSFFPFTEPSAEVDIWFQRDDAAGGRWMEILGCGMVDPNVLRAVDVDPEEYSGFAFGMGIERITMLRHGIDDIRLLYENDLRFLDQFVT